MLNTINCDKLYFLLVFCNFFKFFIILMTLIMYLDMVPVSL